MTQMGSEYVLYLQYLPYERRIFSPLGEMSLCDRGASHAVQNLGPASPKPPFNSPKWGKKYFHYSIILTVFLKF
jgi:hypothetical protein